MSEIKTNIRVGYIKAEQCHTLAGEQDGSLDEALRAENLENLACYYYGLRCSSHGSNPVFGGAFRSWRNRVGRILTERGVTEITMGVVWPHTISVRNNN